MPTRLGAATLFDPPFASLAFDLIAGPDNWRLSPSRRATAGSSAVRSTLGRVRATARSAALGGALRRIDRRPRSRPRRSRRRSGRSRPDWRPRPGQARRPRQRPPGWLRVQDPKELPPASIRGPSTSAPLRSARLRPERAAPPLSVLAIGGIARRPRGALLRNALDSVPQRCRLLRGLPDRPQHVPAIPERSRRHSIDRRGRTGEGGSTGDRARFAHGQRAATGGGRRAETPPRPAAPRGPPPDRHPRRLRHEPVRRLHRPSSTARP